MSFAPSASHDPAGFGLTAEGNPSSARPGTDRHEDPAKALASGNLAIRLVLTVVAMLAVLTAAVLALFWAIGTELSRAGSSPSTELYRIDFGQDTLQIPANEIRFRAHRRSGQAERLDLYYLWPAMTGYTEAFEAEFDSETLNPNLLFVTVEPRRMTADMAGRLDPIYKKFLEGEPVALYDGLVAQRLSAKSGYIGEYLVVSGDGKHVGRCVDVAAKGATPYCISDIQVGTDLSVTYRFHASLLGQWMDIDHAFRARIDGGRVETF